jgi:hypothetical protein
MSEQHLNPASVSVVPRQVDSKVRQWLSMPLDTLRGPLLEYREDARLQRGQLVIILVYFTRKPTF